MKRFAVAGMHLAYWGVYFLLLILFELISWHSGHFTSRGIWQGIFTSPATILTSLPAMVTFYVFYTVLFSRLLKRRRVILLGLTGIGVSIGASLFVFLGIGYILFPWQKNGFSWDTGRAILVLSLIAFANGVLALVMRGFITFYRDIQLKEYLKRQNAELELALIKSQISPHFLFNTLNNIDVLIEKDAARASGYLNKLSDILRFMLYETKTDRIPVGEELRYIGKYIELQKIRTAHPEYIQFAIEGDGDQLMVEPLLFLPFIENAFKHAGKKEEGAIKIRFKLEREKIIFDCENRYDPKGPALPEANGGLGNGIIRRRLQLLYPDRHSLEINADREVYKATLILTNNAN
ncbi:MAG TPA: sensor histidine kinase [Puia sp.]|nr:sensor histidine kinase [Puia sp.]